MNLVPSLQTTKSRLKSNISQPYERSASVRFSKGLRNSCPRPKGYGRVNLKHTKHNIRLKTPYAHIGHVQVLPIGRIGSIYMNKKTEKAAKFRSNNSENAELRVLNVQMRDLHNSKIFFILLFLISCVLTIRNNNFHEILTLDPTTVYNLLW